MHRPCEQYFLLYTFTSKCKNIVVELVIGERWAKSADFDKFLSNV